VIEGRFAQFQPASPSRLPRKRDQVGERGNSISSRIENLKAGSFHGDHGEAVARHLRRRGAWA